jgi:hypothetical protein
MCLFDGANIILAGGICAISTRGSLVLTQTARRHAEAELARARAVLMNAHAHLVDGIASRAGGQLTTARIVECYVRAQDLAEFDEQWLRIHAVARAGHGGLPHRDDGVLRGVISDLAEQVRDSMKPYSDSQLRALLASEFAVARATIIRVHVRNAIRLARILAPELHAASAVRFYISSMNVPGDFAGAVHAFAVSHLASEARASRLPAGRGLIVGSSTREGVAAPDPAWLDVQPLDA